MRLARRIGQTTAIAALAAMGVVVAPAAAQASTYGCPYDYVAWGYGGHYEVQCLPEYGWGYYRARANCKQAANPDWIHTVRGNIVHSTEYRASIAACPSDWFIYSYWVEAV